MRIATLAGVALCTLALGGCANMTPNQQRMLSGGVIGVSVGAAGTLLTGGCVACGAAIGGVVGAGAGYVVDAMAK